jgi:uncharacterized protein
MQAVSVPLDEIFRVVIVDEERADEPGGYEPVIANAQRLDLRWLAEEQVLLALPLVPTHERDDCAQAVQAGAAALAEKQQPAAEGDDETRQKPFQNLRDLMRER